MKTLLFKNLTQEAQKRALIDHRDHMAENKKSMKPQEAFDYWNESIYEFYENGVHLAFEKNIYQMQISEDTQEQNLCVHVGEHLVRDSKPRYTRWLHDTEGFQVYEKGQWHDAQSIDWDDVPPATQEEPNTEDDNPYTRLKEALTYISNEQPHKDFDTLIQHIKRLTSICGNVLDAVDLEDETPKPDEGESLLSDTAGLLYRQDAYEIRDALRDYKHIISGSRPALIELNACPTEGCDGDFYRYISDSTIEEGIIYANCNCEECKTTWSEKYVIQSYEVDEKDAPVAC